MENFVEHRTCIATPPASSSPQYSSPSLSFHNSSRAISKSKPKVRIIHIFAPEIIKTDVANFRELVQRLTGKPTARDRARRKNKRPRAAKRAPEDIISVAGESPAARINRLVEFRRGREEGVIKEEGDDYEEDEVMWVDRNYVHNYGGDRHQSYLNAFGDFDGLIQELGDHDEFSFLQNLDHGQAANYNLHGGFV